MHDCRQVRAPLQQQRRAPPAAAPAPPPRPQWRQTAERAACIATRHRSGAHAAANAGGVLGKPTAPAARRRCCSTDAPAADATGSYMRPSLQSAGWQARPVPQGATAASLQPQCHSCWCLALLAAAVPARQRSGCKERVLTTASSNGNVCRRASAGRAGASAFPQCVLPGFCSSVRLLNARSCRAMQDKWMMLVPCCRRHPADFARRCTTGVQTRPNRCRELAET